MQLWRKWSFSCPFKAIEAEEKARKQTVGVDVVWELAWLGHLSKTVSIAGQAAGKDS